MGRSLVVLALLGLLLVAPGLASKCIAYPPPLKQGAACGFNTYCDSNILFCSNEGACTKRLADGQPCEGDEQCSPLSRCRGPTGGKICLALVIPGKPCNMTYYLTGPVCGSQCDPNDRICKGGTAGDACFNSVEGVCVGKLTCTNGFCTPLEDGATCETASDCKATSFCDTNAKCRARKTEGMCRAAGDCAYGYSCLGYSPSDFKTCVEWKSRKPGEYCENSIECKGNTRCVSSICSTKKGNLCTSSNDCSEGEMCSCGSTYLNRGQGSCRTDPCITKDQKLSECLSASCYQYSLFPQSCSMINCADEVNAYLAACGFD